MPSPPDLLQLEDQLRGAQRDHDDCRRNAHAIAASTCLDADNDLWTRLGAAIASLAHLIRQACHDSRFGDARPEATALAARLSESIDDQVDAAAWAVIDASARLKTAVLQP